MNRRSHDAKWATIMEKINFGKFQKISPHSVEIFGSNPIDRFEGLRVVGKGSWRDR